MTEADYVEFIAVIAGGAVGFIMAYVLNSLGAVQMTNNAIIDAVDKYFAQHLDPTMKGARIPPCIGHAFEQDKPFRVYLIGSLRNPEVALLGNRLRKLGIEVFDDWHAAGPEADDHWQAYEKAKGNNYRQALAGAAAQNVFEFDKRNLLASDAVILVAPAGKSGHLELGWSAGKGKKTCVFYTEEPERYDVMYNFCDYVALNEDEVINWIKEVN